MKNMVKSLCASFSEASSMTAASLPFSQGISNPRQIMSELQIFQTWKPNLDQTNVNKRVKKMLQNISSWKSSYIGRFVVP
mmetsp:Transcript_36514/g.74174  ORF Transcript_36514/g.74174 Transcript_36514/m.74174 type:complete len:80 (+) Transcript_36514:207-446(+)